MPTVNDIFKALKERHVNASDINNLSAIESLCVEFEILLNEAPDEINLLFAIGTSKLQLGLNGAAMAYFRRCVELKDDLPEVWNNLGSAYKAEHKNDEARVCWEKCLTIREHCDYYNNLSTLYVNEGNPEEGLQFSEKGMELEPDHKRLHWNYALMLLELGRWEEGFNHYEYGIASMDRPHRNYLPDTDWWTGDRKKVVVYGEQGMGDEIMFASCIPDMMKECEVIFECHPRLVSLFKRSFGVPCYGTRKNNEIKGDPPWPTAEQVEAKIAIGSLFGIYRRDGFPRNTYLTPDPELVAQYHERLTQTGPGPYIGIAWTAGAKKTRLDLRSLKLRYFLPIIEQGGTFISLQYTEGAGGKCDRFFADSGHRIHHWPEVVESHDLSRKKYLGFNYDHTVALIEALDLLVVPNTTAVHVCGAIGKECITITPSAPAWRYQLTGDKMPMYGDWVTQVRELDSWEETFEQVSELVKEKLWPQNISLIATKN